MQSRPAPPCFTPSNARNKATLSEPPETATDDLLARALAAIEALDRRDLEVVLGEALEGRRGEVVLVSKFGHTPEGPKNFSVDWFWESPKTVPVQHLRDVAAELLQNEPGQLAAYEPPGRLLPVLAAADDPAFMHITFVEPAFQV